MRQLRAEFVRWAQAVASASEHGLDLPPFQSSSVVARRLARREEAARADKFFGGKAAAPPTPKAVPEKPCHSNCTLGKLTPFSCRHSASDVGRTLARNAYGVGATVHTHS